jgi:hypothetical protein
LDISELQFLFKKKFIFISFLQFLVIKILDPDPDSLEMLDPQLCYIYKYLVCL